MFKKIRNVNYNEFYKVNEIVAKTSPMMTHYHSPNPAERWLWKQKKIRINKILNNLTVKNIIDLGCGDAGMLNSIPENINYYGIDISPTQIKYAKKTISEIKRINAKVEIGDILSLKLTDNSFDSLLMCDVLEHVLKPEKLIKEATRIVRKNGYIIISVPHESLWVIMRALLLRFPLHSPDHLQIISTEDIKSHFKYIENEINIPFKYSSKLSLIHLFLIKNVK